MKNEVIPAPLKENAVIIDRKIFLFIISKYIKRTHHQYPSMP